MPAKAPPVSPGVAGLAASLGKQIRKHRKALGVSMTAAAESAGMSRTTWYRIEHGELSVTLGAALAALDALGITVSITAPSEPDAGGADEPISTLPLRIPLAEYPQLKQLAWQVQGVDELSPREALGIYERNWRHLDQSQLSVHERSLINALQTVLGGSHQDV